MKLRYAIARCVLIADYLKPNKLYKIEQWNRDGTFAILDEEGERILCDRAQCYHLFEEAWEIQTLTCENQDNVIVLPEGFNERLKEAS